MAAGEAFAGLWSKPKKRLLDNMMPRLLSFVHCLQHTGKNVAAAVLDRLGGVLGKSVGDAAATIGEQSPQPPRNSRAAL